jgi:hypothetical protein
VQPRPMKGPVVAISVALALLGAAGAQAKAPPDGVQICGADGACINVSPQQAEQEWALWSPGDPYEGSAAASVSPFYVVHWHWPGGPVNTGYYIPAAGKTWQRADDGSASWFDVHDARGLRSMTASLQPFGAPRFARVMVGRRVVRDPGSYATLFGRGYDVWPMIMPGWIPVRFEAATPNPWSDPGTDVRISYRGALLWESGTIVKIRLGLARRIRRGASLRG